MKNGKEEKENYRGLVKYIHILEQTNPLREDSP